MLSLWFPFTEQYINVFPVAQNYFVTYDFFHGCVSFCYVMHMSKDKDSKSKREIPENQPSVKVKMVSGVMFS